jgi:hypothetical protein
LFVCLTLIYDTLIVQEEHTTYRTAVRTAVSSGDKPSLFSTGNPTSGDTFGGELQYQPPALSQLGRKLLGIDPW